MFCRVRQYFHTNHEQHRAVVLVACGPSAPIQAPHNAVVVDNLLCLLNIEISVGHAQGERHANPPHGNDYRACHARQPARLWAGGIRQGTDRHTRNERKAVWAGCGRWRSNLDPTAAAGRRSAKRCAQKSRRRRLRRPQLCATWDAVKKNDTASRGSRAAGADRAPLRAIQLLSGFSVSILLLRLFLLRLLAHRARAGTVAS